MIWKYLTALNDCTMIDDDVCNAVHAHYCWLVSYPVLHPGQVRCHDHVQQEMLMQYDAIEPGVERNPSDQHGEGSVL